MTGVLCGLSWLIYLVSLIFFKFIYFVKLFAGFSFSIYLKVLIFVYYNPIIFSIIFLFLTIIYLLFYKNTFEFCLMINKFFYLPLFIAEEFIKFKFLYRPVIGSNLFNLFFEEIWEDDMVDLLNLNLNLESFIRKYFINASSRKTSGNKTN